MVLQNSVVVGRFEGTPTIVLAGAFVGSGAGEPTRVVETPASFVVVVADDVVGPSNDWIVELGDDGNAVVVVVVLAGTGATVGAIVLGNVEETPGGITTTPVAVVSEIELGHDNA